MNFKNIIVIIITFFTFMLEQNLAAKPSILMQLKYGDVIIELYPDKAPAHVERILDLTNSGFYNGINFHRVIAGFMAQTGDPLGNGTGSSDKPNLKAEFNDMKHERGIVSMARASDPNSANSQFFIMFDNAPHLDKQYTVFGRVISGMEFIDMVAKGDPNRGGMVQNPDKILKMTVISQS